MDTCLRDTAFREANEEIGLERDNFEFVAQLCPFVSPVGHYIAPVLVLLKNNSSSSSSQDPFEDTLELAKSLRPQSNEVAGIFWAPLGRGYLLDPRSTRDVYTLTDVPFNNELMRKFTNIKSITRVFINFDERLFQTSNDDDDVQPTTPFLYGINATILLLVALTVYDESAFRLELAQNSDDKPFVIEAGTIRIYAETFKMFGYFMCLAEILKKNYDKFRSKL